MLFFCSLACCLLTLWCTLAYHTTFPRSRHHAVSLLTAGANEMVVTPMTSGRWSMHNWRTGRRVGVLESLGVPRSDISFKGVQPTLPTEVQQGLQRQKPSTPSGSVPSNVGPGAKAFSMAVLKGIGAPANSANVRSIEAWIAREGGGGANNPLNTTLYMPGSTVFNSVGVRNYPSVAVGVLATIKTLQASYYTDIVGALKAGKGLCGRSFQGLSTWSGNGYSSVC